MCTYDGVNLQNAYESNNVFQNGEFWAHSFTFRLPVLSTNFVKSSNIISFFTSS